GPCGHFRMLAQYRLDIRFLWSASDLSDAPEAVTGELRWEIPDAIDNGRPVFRRCTSAQRIELGIKIGQSNPFGKWSISCGHERLNDCAKRCHISSRISNYFQIEVVSVH